MKNEPQPHHKTNPHLTLTLMTVKKGDYLMKLLDNQIFPSKFDKAFFVVSLFVLVGWIVWVLISSGIA